MLYSMLCLGMLCHSCHSRVILGSCQYDAAQTLLHHHPLFRRSVLVGNLVFKH